MNEITKRTVELDELIEILEYLPFDHMISDGGTNLVDWYAVKSHIEKKSLLGLDEYWENEFSGTYPEFRNSYWS